MNGGGKWASSERQGFFGFRNLVEWKDYAEEEMLRPAEFRGVEVACTLLAATRSVWNDGGLTQEIRDLPESSRKGTYLTEEKVRPRRKGSEMEGIYSEGRNCSLIPSKRI